MLLSQYTKSIQTNLKSINMPRCIAQKANGTQCKCSSLIGSDFCGTHQNWPTVVNYDNCKKYTFIPDEPYVPAPVEISVVKRSTLSDLYRMIGR